MSLKLIPNPTFKCKVSIPTPEGDAEITVEYKYLGRSQLRAFIKKAEDSTDDFALLSEIVFGWDGVDKDFSPEAFSQLIDTYHAASRVLLNTYLKELTQQRVDF